MRLKKLLLLELGFALSLSYVTGTILFNYEVSQREVIAVVLTTITLFCSLFLPKNQEEQSSNKVNHSLIIMVLWVFLDSSLFESLSRDLAVLFGEEVLLLKIKLFQKVNLAF